MLLVLFKTCCQKTCNDTAARSLYTGLLLFVRPIGYCISCRPGKETAVTTTYTLLRTSVARDAHGVLAFNCWIQQRIKQRDRFRPQA